MFRNIKSSLRADPPSGCSLVDVEDVAKHLELGTLTAEDSLTIFPLISSAIEQVEKDCQRSIVQREWKLYLDTFPCSKIELRMPPVISVDSITYIDTADSEQTLSDSLYDTDLTSAPGRIFPSPSSVWPSTICKPNAVTVTFTAGYTEATLPHTLKEAILLATAALYSHCEPGKAYWSKINRNRWEAGL